VIIRPEGLKEVGAKIFFNLRFFSQLEIDLEHVNQGKTGLRATKYQIDDIARIVHALLDEKILAVSKEKKYGDEIFTKGKNTK
jgi:hypothetical protein